MVNKSVLLVFFFIVLCTSCETVDYKTVHFNNNTENLAVLLSGTIGKKAAVSNENIIVDGTVDILPPNVWQNMKYYNRVAKRVWSGNVIFNGQELELQVDSHITHEDQYTDSEFLSSSTQNKSDITGIRGITIKKLPKEYSFKKFDVVKPILFNYIEEDDMPLKVTDFSVDDKTFRVLLTVKNDIKNLDTPLSLFQHPKQIFQIVDDTNTVYAEYTLSHYEFINFQGYEYSDGTYTIFDVDESFDETKLVPVIAVIDIIKYMIQYSDSVNFTNACHPERSRRV